MLYIDEEAQADCVDW